VNKFGLFNPNISVNIAGLAFANPVMPASGTFASGREFARFIDLDALGAVVTKGVSPEPWEGNPTPRVAETYGGMLNAIGLQNAGIDAFIRDDLPFLETLKTNVIVNVCGKTVQEYLTVIDCLNDSKISMFEINVSCPNIKEGGIAFGQDPVALRDITCAVKDISKKPVIMKLSPNVTDIRIMAKAAAAGGADALSLINTITGMSIDIKSKKPVLANLCGGLSGPAIKPIALRMVWQATQSVDIPVFGMGGIASWEDALEFIMAGASAVMVGTMNFVNPHTMTEIISGIKTYMIEQGVEDIVQLRGVAKK